MTQTEQERMQIYKENEQKILTKLFKKMDIENYSFPSNPKSHCDAFFTTKKSRVLVELKIRNFDYITHCLEGYFIEELKWNNLFEMKKEKNATTILYVCSFNDVLVVYSLNHNGFTRDVEFFEQKMNDKTFKDFNEKKMKRVAALDFDSAIDKKFYL